MDTASPTILKTPDLNQTASQISKDPKSWFKRNLIPVVIIVLVVIVAGVGAASYFSPSSGRSILQPQVNELRGAQLSLIPDKSSYKKGETVVVDVKLYTGGRTTQSADIVVKYDPEFLTPVVEGPVTEGQIFSDYLDPEIRDNLGLIGVSGIFTEAKSPGFSGIAGFAKLNFLAMKEGQTEITLDYQPDQTADSNVLSSDGTSDLLSSVDSASIVISDTTAAPSTLPQSCGSFTQYCEDGTGQVGTQVCNAGTISNGVCGYSPQLTTSCEVCTIN